MKLKWTELAKIGTTVVKLEIYLDWRMHAEGKHARTLFFPI